MNAWNFWVMPVLDFIAGAWLYNHFPEMAEGELTRMRSAMVCTEQLAEFARAFDLGSAMRLGHGEDKLEDARKMSFYAPPSKL